ncbi:uncharacterized protein SPAPADRAFT_131772 [Spathaspora passalidarum NRRL Y-27907]|uniref:Uncharacterized protein n=1 Tax=Spathaspora passalidarum (strain NRRL Y-27907 / 11-Y1) TaxID=619300 RepID=G3AEA6_SPAPN|nr:uncharacterized protein SPAPADRAFT_131772 [Spathaspora passalidarum NRRL Y-27907]EGW35640.1 hypothetical protein SPAPADRAFT_131772 [Spathaspora passalidarum NRRL Y-27907]
MLRFKALRVYTLPPRSSYIINKTYPLVLWNNLIPYKFKFFTGLGTVALSIKSLHPNTVIACLPPLTIGYYFGYKRWRHWLYLNNSTRAEQSGVVRFERYDETKVENVLSGIENEYDCLTRQIVDVVEQRVIEHVAETSDDVSELFVHDDQFSMHIFPTEVETWITSEVDVDGELVKFIKMSMPFYSVRDVETRKRLGVVTVYLRQVAKSEHEDFHMHIEVSPLTWFKPKVLVINDVPDVLNSKLFEERNKSV